jgi:hypothetical protein
MRGKSKKNAKRIAVFMAVVFFLAGAYPALLKAGNCEIAFYRCINDPLWVGNFLGQVYCGTGYLFCKKYVES